jgi:hypothetical protein
VSYTDARARALFFMDRDGAETEGVAGLSMPAAVLGHSLLVRELVTLRAGSFTKSPSTVRMIHRSRGVIDNRTALSKAPLAKPAGRERAKKEEVISLGRADLAGWTNDHKLQIHIKDYFKVVSSSR